MVEWEEEKAWRVALGVPNWPPVTHDFVWNYTTDRFEIFNLKNMNKFTKFGSPKYHHPVPLLNMNEAHEIEELILANEKQFRLVRMKDQKYVYIVELEDDMKQHAHTMEMFELISPPLVFEDADGEDDEAVQHHPEKVPAQENLNSLDENQKILMCVVALSPKQRTEREDVAKECLDKLRDWDRRQPGLSKIKPIAHLLYEKTTHILNSFLGGGADCLPEVYKIFYGPLYNFIVDKLTRGKEPKHKEGILKINNRSWAIICRTLSPIIIRRLCEAAQKHNITQLQLYCETEAVPQAVETVYSHMWRRHYHGLNDAFHWLSDKCHQYEFEFIPSETETADEIIEDMVHSVATDTKKLENMNVVWNVFKVLLR